jgi:uncharacterized RDD family membrane protein YckC
MPDGILTASGITLGYATRSTRLLGQLVDGAIATAPFTLVTFLGLGLFLAIPAGLWAAFYYMFADGLQGGQSFAKRWLGVRVVDEKTGEPCTFGQSSLRNILAVLGPIDWVFIFGDRHQRLGDKAAGTVVVIAD